MEATLSQFIVNVISNARSYKTILNIEQHEDMIAERKKPPIKRALCYESNS
jgi:hypothetical protein